MSLQEIRVIGTGTAGSAAAGVVTVQGTASGTAIPVSLTSTTVTGIVEVSPTTSANTSTNPFFSRITDGTTAITSAISSYGSAPTGTEVMGVNAFVTNTANVTGSLTPLNPGSFVQSVGSAFSFTSPGTFTQTLTGVKSGDTIVVAISYTSTFTLTGITDTFGNVYGQIDSTEGPENGLKFEVFYAPAVAGGNTVVTATFTGAGTVAGELIAIEYAGTLASISGTGYPSGTVNTGITFSTGNFGPTVIPNTMAIVFAYAQSGSIAASNPSSLVGDAFAPRFLTTNYLVADCAVNSTATYAASFTQTSSSGFAMIWGVLRIMNSIQPPLIQTNSFTAPVISAVAIAGCGSGGTGAGGVLSIQGVGSGIVVPTTDAANVTLTTSVGGSASTALAMAGHYTTTQPAPTNNQTVAIQSDQAGNLLEFPGVQIKTGSAWVTATTINTLQYPTGTTTIGAAVGAAATIVQLDMSSTTFTAGAVTFQGTYDGTNWVTIPVAQILNPNSYTQLTNPYTFINGTNQVAFLVLLQGYQNIRLNLSTAITGTGTPTVTPYWTVLPTNPLALSGGIAATTAPTLTGGQPSPLQLDSAGNLRANIYGQTGSALVLAATGTGATAGVPAITVPSGYKYILQCFTLTITVANSGTARPVQGYVYNGANVMAAVNVGVSAPIAATTSYTFAPGMPLSTAIVALGAEAPFPALVLGPSSVITCFITGGVAGDSVSLVATVLKIPD